MSLDPPSTTSSNGEEEDMIEDTRQGPDSKFPPGFHFNPFDHELILYYLRRKIANIPLLYDVFNDVNLYEYNPEQLVEIYAAWGVNRWYFFTPRDRKYPNGTRPNRKTVDGYWKATGVEKRILCNDQQIGVRKALVFYTGKAGKGEKTDWIMYEYINHDPSGLPRKPDGTMKLDDWVLCTIQKKRGADGAKSDQPSEAGQASTNQSTEKQKITHVQRIQQDGRETDLQQIQQHGREPLNYQVEQQIQRDDREVEQPIQQNGREVEPPPNYQFFQPIQQFFQPIQLEPIQQDGREVEPPPNYQFFQPIQQEPIQQDGREVAPPPIIVNMGCYDSDANYNNYSVTQAPAISSNDFMGFMGWPMDLGDYNNYSVPPAPAISSNDFMGFMGWPMDLSDYSPGDQNFQQNFSNPCTESNYTPGDQNFQQNFPNPCTESNGLGCQLDHQALDLEYQNQQMICGPHYSLPMDLEDQNQQMICGPHYSLPTVMPVNECQCQGDIIEAELNSFLYEENTGVGLDNADDMAQVFSSQDGIVCQNSQDNHSNVNFINNSDYRMEGEGFKFKQN